MDPGVLPQGGLQTFTLFYKECIQVFTIVKFVGGVCDNYWMAGLTFYQRRLAKTTAPTHTRHNAEPRPHTFNYLRNTSRAGLAVRSNFNAKTTSERTGHVPCTCIHTTLGTGSLIQDNPIQSHKVVTADVFARSFQLCQHKQDWTQVRGVPASVQS